MIALDHDAPEALYQQLFNDFKARILSGELKPGLRLPASRVLAQELHISRISVVNAYTALENAGLVISRARRGLFVADKLPAVSSTWLLNDGDFTLSEAHRASYSQDYPPLISLSNGSLPAEFMPVDAMRQALNTVLD